MTRDLREELHDHDRGLAFDVATLLSRRRALQLLAGTGLTALVGCTSDSGGSSTSASTSGASTPASPSASASTAAPGPATAGSNATCAEIPAETAGPFPGDGSNGPDVLRQTGIVRSDIRSSFGSASGTAGGVPLTINLTVLNRADGCTAVVGAAVYIWHCDREGRYSLYSEGVTAENYLRGVQQADANGRVSFRSIFPGAYSGRWPHAHFEVYPSLSAVTSAGSKLATSQLALPESACNLVYATAGYGDSIANLADLSLESDNVFGDGWDQQLAKVAGNVRAGFTAELTVPVGASA